MPSSCTARTPCTPLSSWRSIRWCPLPPPHLTLAFENKIENCLLPSMARLRYYGQLSGQLVSTNGILFPEVSLVWRRVVLELMRPAFSCTACHKEACNCLVPQGWKFVSACAQHSTILQGRFGSLTNVQMCSHCW